MPRGQTERPAGQTSQSSAAKLHEAATTPPFPADSPRTAKRNGRSRRTDGRRRGDRDSGRLGRRTRRRRVGDEGCNEGGNTAPFSLFVAWRERGLAQEQAATNRGRDVRKGSNALILLLSPPPVSREAVQVGKPPRKTYLARHRRAGPGRAAPPRYSGCDPHVADSPWRGGGRGGGDAGRSHAPNYTSRESNGLEERERETGTNPGEAPPRRHATTHRQFLTLSSTALVCLLTRLHFTHNTLTDVPKSTAGTRVRAARGGKIHFPRPSNNRGRATVPGRAAPRLRLVPSRRSNNIQRTSTAWRGAGPYLGRRVFT